MCSEVRPKNLKIEPTLICHTSIWTVQFRLPPLQSNRTPNSLWPNIANVLFIHLHTTQCNLSSWWFIARNLWPKWSAKWMQQSEKQNTRALSVCLFGCFLWENESVSIAKQSSMQMQIIHVNCDMIWISIENAIAVDAIRPQERISNCHCKYQTATFL